MKKYQKNDVLIYLNNIYTKTKDDRLNDSRVKLDIISLLKETSKITELSIPDLLATIYFKPNSLNIEGLEAFLSELRAIIWLNNFGFSNIRPIKAKKDPQPDFLADYQDKKSTIEVFCLTQTHEQRPEPPYKDKSLNVYVNFDPEFDSSKFGRDFISKAKDKKKQLDSLDKDMKIDIKILLCVVNSQSMVSLNKKDDWDKHAEYLYNKLNWGNNYYIGILTGSGDTIYPKIK
jgi:hypothetical protein